MGQLEEMSTKELIDLVNKNEPGYKPPSMIAGLAQDAGDYYRSLHEPTEPATSVKDFATRVLPQSLGKTTVGAVEYPYHLAKSFTDPLLTKKPLSGMSEALYSNVEGLVRGTGEPLGAYGLKELKNKWLSDPIGSVLGIMPLMSHIKFKNIKPVMEEHVRTGKPLSELIDIPRETIDKYIGKKSTSELIDIVEQNKPKPVEIPEQNIGGYSPVLSNTQKEFSPQSGKEGVKPFKDVMAEQRIGEYSPVLGNIQKGFLPKEEGLPKGVRPFKDISLTTEEPKGVVGHEGQRQAEAGQVAPIQGQISPEVQPEVTAFKPEAPPAMAAAPPVTTPIVDLKNKRFNDLARESDEIQSEITKQSDLPLIEQPEYITEILNKAKKLSLAHEVLRGMGKAKRVSISFIEIPEFLTKANKGKAKEAIQQLESLHALSNKKAVSVSRTAGLNSIVADYSGYESFMSGNLKWGDTSTSVKESLKETLKEPGSKPADWLGKTPAIKVTAAERQLLKEAETTTPEIYQLVRDEISKPNIFEEIKSNVGEFIKIDQSLIDHFSKTDKDLQKLIKSKPGMFSYTKGSSFDEVAQSLSLDGDELTQRLKDVITREEKLRSAERLIAEYKQSQLQPEMVNVGELKLKVGTEFKINGEKYKVIQRDENGDFVIKDGDIYTVDEFNSIPKPDEGSIKQPSSKIKQTKFEYDKTKIDTRPKMESSLTNPALQTGQKSFLKKGDIQPKQKKEK